MYKEHPSFVLPDKETKIWRYINVPKFIWMLMNESLYFPRADQLNDPFEGSIGKLGRQSWEEPYKDIPKSKQAKGWEPWHKLPETMRNRIFVNSWHMKAYESAAMWELYGDTQNGLAIQSTVKKLINSMKSTGGDVYIGEVKYIDYIEAAPNPWNALNPFIHKLRDFEHESELRAIISYEAEGKHFLEVSKNEIPNGISLPINIEELVEKIILSPNAGQYLEDIIASLCKKYKKNLSIASSTRKLKPIY